MGTTRTSLVIVGYLNIFWTSGRPNETDTPLVVDTNTVLPGTVAPEQLQMVAWWHPKIVQDNGSIQHRQFPQSHAL